MTDGAEPPDRNGPRKDDPRQDDAPWWRRGFRNGSLLAVLVLGAFVGLHRADLASIGGALSDLPLAIGISAAVHLPQIVLTALAWRTLVPAAVRPSPGAMSLLR